ncbi:efflux protein, MATE family [Sorangium cellulosum]|uniref:Multidrug-efflux transporter n=1 Tax=Sorangium cellulosum TaxID=56 RepID=A0A2L0F9P8_SORCE|nr:efflux protein, MATE family [Sorangium cellulosum]
MALAGQVWRLAWPAIAHMLLLTLVFLVGRGMVGRHSTTALAAMQLCGPLTWTIVSVFTATSAGTLAVVARGVGAGDRALAAAAARTSLIFALALGAAVALPLLAACGPLLRALFPEAGAEVVAQATAYLDIVLPALPLAFVVAVATSALQGAGDTKTPLVVATIGNVVNVAVSAVLIFGYLGLPALGVRGAAAGAACTMAAEAALLTAALLSRSSPLPLRAAPDASITGGAAGAHDRRAARSAARKERAAALGRVLRVAAPAFAERSVYHAGYMGFVAIIGLLGGAAMAANQALIAIESVCFLSADGFGIAAGALMAQRLGAQRPRDAARAGLIAALMAIAALSAFGALFAFAPRPLLLAFSSDPELLALGERALPVAAVAQPFMAFATVIGMGLRGAGDTRTVLAVTLVCSLVVRLGGTWLFAITLGYGLVGVWMGSTADWICRSVMLAVAYARGRWRGVAV